jgi:hypothetical protein
MNSARHQRLQLPDARSVATIAAHDPDEEV